MGYTCKAWRNADWKRDDDWRKSRKNDDDRHGRKECKGNDRRHHR